MPGRRGRASIVASARGPVHRATLWIPNLLRAHSNDFFRFSRDDAPVHPRAVAPSGRRLWLVRHGESTWNALGLVQGHADGPELTGTGARQARACARSLAGEPVEAVYSSDLARAARTAEPVGRALGLPVWHDARLRERCLGVAEGRSAHLLGDRESGISGGRVVDADAAPAGGESVRELYARAVSCAHDALAAHRAGDVVLVCHGGVVRVLLAWLGGAGPDDMAWPEVPNGALIARPATTRAAAS